VGYEVYCRRGTTSYTTTNNSIDIGNPIPANGIHCVRALDAAGNASPGACFILGPGDIIDPAVPTNLRIGAPVRGYLPVSWDPSWDDLVVLGYEVYLNDVLVRTVGGVKAYVPYRGPGIYKVGVRAYDTMRRFSPMAELILAIDPPGGIIGG